MDYYHVIIQSNRGQNIFPDGMDCLAYLLMVKKACEKYQLHWLAYAVMPTHVHLVVGGETEAISKARRKIACGYTAYLRKNYPEKVRANEPVFRRRSEVKWLQKPYDLKQVIRYVHFNPIRKNLESVLGEDIRSSYSIPLAIWNPQDEQNPFNRFWDLHEIRDALDVAALQRIFGKNQNQQKDAYIAFHTQPMPEESISDEKLQLAEQILKGHFSYARPFSEKTFTPENRQAFLTWLHRHNNTYKNSLILTLSEEAALSSREIAAFLKIGSTTVKEILQKYKG